MNQCTCVCTCGMPKKRVLHLKESPDISYRMLGVDADGQVLFTKHRPILSGGKWWNGGGNTYGPKITMNDNVPRMFERVSTYEWEETE